MQNFKIIFQILIILLKMINLVNINSVLILINAIIIATNLNIHCGIIFLHFWNQNRMKQLLIQQTRIKCDNALTLCLIWIIIIVKMITIIIVLCLEKFWRHEVNNYCTTYVIVKFKMTSPLTTVLKQLNISSNFKHVTRSKQNKTSFMMSFIIPFHCCNAKFLNFEPLATRFFFSNY